MRVDSWVSLGESVALQHVEQCGLASIVQAQENYIGAFLEETKPLERTFEEIENEHFVWVVIY